MSKYPSRVASPRRSQAGLPPNDYEEFASLQLDRPGEGELKSAEEMKRHLFDDHFEGRPIERAMHILASGEEVQRLSVIRDLLHLIHSDEQGCLQRVIQKIQQVLNNASTEFHIETARAFGVVLQKKAVSYTTFANSFLPSVTYHLDNRDTVVSSAWLETLLIATEVLPVEIVKNNIVTVAINKGQISQNVWQRVASCKLLGKLSLRLDAQSVKKDILPVVLSLCQDVNEAVRACICGQLYFVAKGIPSDTVKTSLIPILVELGRDETVQVRVEATEAIVSITPLLGHDVLKSTIIPLIKKICEQAVVAVDDTLVMVAKQFGGLCLGLEGVLTPTEKIWLVTYYHNLSHLGISTYGPKRDVFFNVNGADRVNARLATRYIECRHFCAYNFPAMAKFCSSSPELLEKVYPSFFDFTADPYYLVRKTVGAGLHEVARILGSNNRVVKNQVLTLLVDNMEEVLMGVVPHLSRTIDHLVSSGVLGREQDGVSFELGRGLLQCDKTIRDKTHNWRLYTDFITQLESIVKCLPSDYIYSHFVSLMFEKMHRARPLPCRLAAARTLLIFLRYNLKPHQRQEIRSRLQAEFCLSSSCYKRMLYLRLCNTAREVFSRAYFKEHFFYPLLSRSEDKVANNRLILIRQFPSLKAMIVMPGEKKHLQTLETCIRSMAVAEKDRDVAAELRVLMHKFDKTETLVDPPTVQTSEDVEDRRKFEEEVRVANTVARPGAVIQIGPLDNRRNKEVRPQPPRTNGARINTVATVVPSTNIVPSTSPRAYPAPSSHSVASSYAPLQNRDTYSTQSFQGKNFEEDFYRDAGVKANEIIGRKLSGIPVYDKPASTVVPPKMSTSFANKRRTWFGNETTNQGTVKLESITGVRSKSFERKKSETLPAKESVSLEKLGIGPRSKSFVLPSTLIYSDKQVSTCQSTKLILNKENKPLKLDNNSGNGLNPSNSQPDTDGNKFGFRRKSREVSQKVEGKVEKSFLKTKIPVGRVGNGSSPVGSRSSSPNLVKEKTDTGLKSQVNGTKKIPVVVSRKSMLIQSNSIKSEVKNNRRSLDSSKISLANLDKPQVLRRRLDKVATSGKGKSGETTALTNGSEIGSEERGDGDAGSSVNSSKLPIRRPKTDK